MTPAVTEHYRDVIARAPGPAPWYLGQVASDLSTPTMKLTWEKGLNVGPTELMDGNRLIYALAAMSCYVREISSTQFVVWYKSGTPGVGEIHFKLYETSSLQPMADEQISFARLKKSPFATAATLLAELSIPQSQSVGLRKVQFPLCTKNFTGSGCITGFGALHTAVVTIYEPHRQHPECCHWSRLPVGIALQLDLAHVRYRKSYLVGGGSRLWSNSDTRRPSRQQNKQGCWTGSCAA
jgi:hypothetical protein